MSFFKHCHGCDFIPQGQSVNAKLYCSVLRESVVAANDLNCAPHNTLKSDTVFAFL